MKAVFPIAAGLVAAVACYEAQSNRASLQTSICVLSRSPGSYDGRTVTVRALLVSTGRDGVRLIDPACPETAVLLAQHNGAVDASVKDLTTELMRGERPPTTMGRRVSGEFTGIFRLSRDGVPRRTFELLKVRDVNIEAGRTKEGAAG